MAAYKTNAIILKRENIFEADRVYHIYTENFGKVRTIAGGVRKINAKLTGHLEPFNLVWVELITKKNGDLFITTALSYGKLLNKNATPAQITLFFKMADFVLKMLKGQQKDERLWNFILGSFLKVGSVEAGLAAQASGSDKFLSEFKNGFINLLGFGDDFDEARYYLNDFGVL